MTTKSTARTVHPYLCFEGRCDEALEFYRKELGAKVSMLMRFKDSPDQAACPASGGDKVMHATFTIGDSTLQASDGRCSGKLNFQGISLSLSVADVAEAERLFAALSNGGTVQMPFSKTFFSPGFGMVADQFGVSWMVYVPGENPAGA